MLLKTIKISLLVIFCFSICNAFSQNKAIPFKDAEKHGVMKTRLDSIYQNAVDIDTSKAVFKSQKEQDTLVDKFNKLFDDLGQFLEAHNFHWEKQTRCFNKVYFNEDGRIDYFLYNFLTKNIKIEDQISNEKQLEFDKLLNQFLRDYKFPVKAKTKFSQCTTSKYLPK
jgi:virulence-associated protein VapD